MSQLKESSVPLGCVKVKVMGNSGAGKTKLIDSLKSGLFSGFLQKAFPSKNNSDFHHQNINHVRNGIKLSHNQLF